MRYLSMFMIAFILVPSIVLAEERNTPRPVDSAAAEAFDRAKAQSAVVRSLVATLESSNVIVHIESSWGLPLGIGGLTRFVATRGGYRYVRISIAADLSPRMRTVILAHELQHACEVATSAADDLAGIRELFEHQGHRTGDYYETRAAIDIERSVRLELGLGSLPRRSGSTGK
jgi:hypothetical protein